MWSHTGMLGSGRYPGRTMVEAPEPVPAPDVDDAVGGPAPAGVPSVARSVLIGVAVSIAVGATSFFLIAIPFYTLASFESHGVDRPIVRTGLFRIALPVGALVGVVVGVVSARWLHRGGRWTTDDGGDRYSAR